MSSSSSSTDDDSTATTPITESVPKVATASSGPAPGADPAIPTLKQASSIWREFQDITEKLLVHSGAYSDIEQSIDRQSAMELEIQTQKVRIQNLESNQQSQIKAFEARYDEWKDERSLLEDQRKQVEEKMAENHAREMDEAGQELVHQTERAKSLAKRLERVNEDVILAKKEFGVCNDKLQQWESYTNKLKDVDLKSLLVDRCSIGINHNILTVRLHRTTKWDQLFRDCYNLVDAHIGLDLPSELLAVRSTSSYYHSLTEAIEGADTPLNRTTLSGRSEWQNWHCRSDFPPLTHEQRRGFAWLPHYIFSPQASVLISSILVIFPGPPLTVRQSGIF